MHQPPKSADKPLRKNINLERRAQIGAERRARSRASLLSAAFHLFGREHGYSTRIEDVCYDAGIARGTFYNHFKDIDELQVELSEELTREFDRAVHIVFDNLEDPVERSSVAIRYYLHAARLNPNWGWAMVNSGVKPQIFGRTVWANSMQTIQEGIDAGCYRLSSARLGRDILIGVLQTAMITLSRGLKGAEYPQDVAKHVLVSFGLNWERAAALAFRPLPALPELAHEHIVVANMLKLDPAQLNPS